MEADGFEGDDVERARAADQRDDAADTREAAADVRERQVDSRERVLDRWEAEIAARAAELHLLDELEEMDRGRARSRRVEERGQRRSDAEARRDDSIERDIRRAQRAAPTPSDPSSEQANVDAPPSFAQLAVTLQTNLPLQDLLEVILAAGVDMVPGCAGVSVALTTEGRLRAAASTAAWAAELDAAQVELGEGPLLAAADGDTVITTDLRADARWPVLAGLSEATAARSVISFGLVLGSAGAGVLSLYSDVGGRFATAAHGTSDMLAALTAVALGRAIERLTYDAQAEALQHALASRDDIGQAKGILMEQRSVTAEEAFNLLRATSQRLNIKLRDVAEHLVTHRRMPDE